MKKARLAILLTVGLIVAAVGGVSVYAQAEYTNCFATFESAGAAERAAQSARDAGFDAEIDREVAVTFSSGETGDDAREFRLTFREALRREGGELGHPGNGCLERQHFE